MGKIYYFDYASATPVDDRVLKAMEPYWQQQFFNPSALYRPAREVRQAIEVARATVAKTIGAKSNEVIFTAGATESINLAIGGVSRPKQDVNVIISAVEHEAVKAATYKNFGKNVKICPVEQSGLINLAALQKLIDSKTTLVSVMQVNNEIGTIQPLRQVVQIVEKARQKRQKQGNYLPLITHSDASQSPNYLPLQVNRLGIDLLSLNGGKIYGPKQSGCLFIRKGVDITPVIAGGGQERGMRGGTENVAAIIGFAKALEIAQASLKQEAQRILKLRDFAFSELRQKIPNVTVNGTIQNRIANNLNITLRGISGEMLVHYLDSAGILTATGAACNAAKDGPSETLLAIGLTNEQANSSLRITFGRPTTKQQIEKLLSELSLAIKTITLNI
jgi:cysteine desulfurase